MSDTIRVRMVGPLKGPRPSRASPIRFFTNPDAQELEAIECSLPRLLFGANVRLITNQVELDAALEKLAEVVAVYAAVPGPGQWRPWRLDLVWQWEGLDASRVIDAMSGLRFPGILSPASRKRMKITARLKTTINFQSLLPEDQPPDAVHIERQQPQNQRNKPKPSSIT